MNTSLFPSRLSTLTAGWVVALAGVARGGSFSTDFSSPPGRATAHGNAFVDTTAGVLVLTPAANDQLGSFIIDDLGPGERVNGNLNTVTDTLGSGPQFYRLVK